MLLNSMDAQRPRYLPEAKSIKGDPPVGMDDLLFWSLDVKRVRICSNREERAVSTVASANAEGAIKD